MTSVVYIFMTMAILILGLTSQLAQAQQFEFFPGAKYDPTVPDLRKILGYDWGEKISMHHEIERYLHALSEASPMIELHKYGETWEGRTLYYLVISSRENLARQKEIKAGMQALADPRRSTGNTTAMLKRLPAVAWLGYAVHGNEISSTDAALLTAYHLAATSNDSLTRKILANTVLIIDPLQNPDGRDRFVSYFRQSRGRWPNPQPLAAEHGEPWPSGRMNHYLFDMNRDWFAMTQPESVGRVRTFLEWYPQVVADLHEMGSNQTYYFPPPANPVNPNMTEAQADWLARLGENNAKWFDKFRFDYFTREVFDSFYPGYGEGGPLFHGAIGMTYEQAGADGLVIERDDRTLLHYRDGIHHHFIASLSTAEAAAEHREALLRNFYEYRRSAINEGLQEHVKEYLIPPGKDPNRALKLATNLMQMGVEVKRARKRFINSRVRDYYGGNARVLELPEGTFVVPAAQPAKRLVKTLMDRHVQMDKEFIKEQVERRKKRRDDEIYDITAWSLPLLYGAECYTADQPSDGDFEILNAPPQPVGTVHGGKAHLAYLIKWGQNNAATALASLLRQEIRVHTTDKAIQLGNEVYPRGSLIIKVKDNPDDLHQRLEQLARDQGLEIFATNQSWVTLGVNLGSEHVKFIKPPKVALVYDRPTNPYSAGWTRYVVEQRLGYPVTAMHGWRLDSSELDKFNVLILPDDSPALGGYAGVLTEAIVNRLKTWVRNGGTLITIEGATHWLTKEKVDMLATRRELRGGKPEARVEEKSGDAPKISAGDSATFNYETAIIPEAELPDRTPGALMRVRLENNNWLSAGYDGFATVMVTSSNIFTPLKMDKGVNIGVYLPSDEALLSGFTWEETLKQIGNKAYLMHQRLGRGHIIAFAEDPNFRGFMDGLTLLFANALFFGPAH